MTRLEKMHKKSNRLMNGRKEISSLRFIFRISLTVIISVISYLPAFSQDTVPVTKERSWSLNGYLKDMQTAIIHTPGQSWITSNLIHNRLNFRWNFTPDFSFCLEERNRLYWGELAGLNPHYQDFVAADNGLLNLSRNIATGKSYILNVDIDRLWLDYTLEKFQVTIGRQRINWSQTFVWNPNDIFNTYSFLDFDYEEKPGSDAVRLQYFTSPSSRAEIAVKADKDRKITAAGLYRLNLWRYDIQLLAGVYTQSDLVLGLGWAGQIAKGGFKGEVSWFRPVRNFGDTTGVVLTSVEYDYTFRNSMMIRFEGFYNSNTTNSANILISQYNPGLLNAKNPFLTGFSMYGSLSYPASPLINLSLAGIYNPSNQMVFIIPTFTFSLMNNLDLSLIAQSFQPYAPGAARLSQTSVFLRLKGSF
ncbi:MAG: hypothetical protein WCO44_00790 [Bacteroidota bacterium]